MRPLSWLLSKLFPYPAKELGKSVIALSISAATKGSWR